jgi:putative hydrolase of the HAD superfamily
MSYRAVIFDLGGVVLGSPLHAIADYERELGIPDNFVNRVVADTAPNGGWARLERGELGLEEFYTAFEADCRSAGQEISAREMMARMARATRPRSAMLGAIRRIRGNGLRVAALTNNWVTEGSDGEAPGHQELRELFDVFIESSVEGLRKPDPRIYELTCARLGVTPQQSVFLDDIGRNLKPAREIGFTTIRVATPEDALEELEEILGFSITG